MCDVSLNPILAGSSNYNGLSERDQDTIYEVKSTDIHSEVPSEYLNFEERKNRLQETYIENTELESRKRLLESLLNEKLATRDIFHFLKNQAQQRRVDKSLDTESLNQTMRTKITDIKRSRGEVNKERKKLEEELRERLKGKRHKFRRCVRPMKIECKRIREKLIKKYRRKIRHYRETQTDPHSNQSSNEKEHEPTSVPLRLKKYESLCIFGKPNDLPNPVKPLGPFICNKNLKISPEEMLILQKEPKFSVRKLTNKVVFQVETEKMLGKHRYRQADKKERKGDRSRGSRRGYTNGALDKWVEEGCEKQLRNQGPGENDKEDESVCEDREKEKSLLKEKDELYNLWDQYKDRYVYNPMTNTVNFSRRKPTDYKLNKFVHLPRPLDSEGEFQCELRRRKYIKAYEKYISWLSDKEEKRLRGSHKKENNETTTVNKPPGGEERINKRSKKTNAKGKRKLEDNNLTKREIKGLESLKKRVMEEEIVVIQTDKSSRFAIMDRKQYLQAGKKHTDKDKAIRWRDVKKLQTVANNHSWWLSRILKYSQETDSERMKRNIQDQGGEIPEMILLAKDHKQWSPESNTCVPTRPVVSGNNCVNTHLSEMLSEILEPVALRMKSAEVLSTEEALSKITELNDKLNRGGDLQDMNILEDMMREDGNDSLTETNEQLRGTCKD